MGADLAAELAVSMIVFRDAFSDLLLVEIFFVSRIRSAADTADRPRFIHIGFLHNLVVFISRCHHSFSNDDGLLPNDDCLRWRRRLRLIVLRSSNVALDFPIPFIKLGSLGANHLIVRVAAIVLDLGNS